MLCCENTKPLELEHHEERETHHVTKKQRTLIPSTAGVLRSSLFVVQEGSPVKGVVDKEATFLLEPVRVGSQPFANKGTFEDE